MFFQSKEILAYFWIEASTYRARFVYICASAKSLANFQGKADDEGLKCK